MKFKTIIGILSEVEKRFFVDGMNIDIDRVEIKDDKQYISMSLQGKLGDGKIKISAEDDDTLFEWDGTIKYRPSIFKWSSYDDDDDDGWMNINIYRR